jgi:hypothetical protein
MYWLTVGKTVGGLQIYQDSKLDRMTALQLYTKGSAWFSQEQQKKGDIAVGMLADLTVLNNDYFTVEDEAIKEIESELTVVAGKIVYAEGDFSSFSPPPIPILPDWSPTKSYGGYYSVSKTAQKSITTASTAQSSIVNSIHLCSGSCQVHAHDHNQARMSNIAINNYTAFWGALGCSCFAF